MGACSDQPLRVGSNAGLGRTFIRSDSDPLLGDDTVVVCVNRVHGFEVFQVYGAIVARSRN
jgi:hypothetical protein